MGEYWFQKSLRRNLVDMHIHGWDDSFLSELDAASYVQHLLQAQVKSALIYAQSHVGYCYWPTVSGEPHPNLAGIDFIGEVTQECRRHGLDVELYYSLVFNTLESEKHPDWQQRDLAGNRIFGLRNARYGTCCPNNAEYRDFTAHQIAELCENYDFDGMWFDMTFWPDICACASCQQRYHDEMGRSFPEGVNWRDPEWVQFQRSREAWMADFGHFATDTARKCKPGITVAHQSGMFLSDWKLCGSVELCKASDFMSADLYGDMIRHSYSSKVFYNLTEELPFEYMTSRCPDLRYHTTTKSKGILREQALSAIANGGGFLFIDAIDPVGTLDEVVYERMSGVFQEVGRFEGRLSGQLRQDVAIYLSMESRVPVDAATEPMAGGNTAFTFEAIYGGNPPDHMVGAYSMAQTLVQRHIPYGVITRKNLSSLGTFDVVILPNVIYMSEEEATAIGEFVSNGGTIVVTGECGTMDLLGNSRPQGMLASVIGGSIEGKTPETVTYIRPEPGFEAVFEPHGSKNPVSVMGSQVQFNANSSTRVIGRRTLPYSHPNDSKHFVSIHSNPPGIDTDEVSIAIHEYGDGKAIYVSANLDMEYYGYILPRLLDQTDGLKSSVRSDAPPCVEITTFDDTTANRTQVHLVNYQSVEPPIPIHDFSVSVDLRIEGTVRARDLLDGVEVRSEQHDKTVTFQVDQLDAHRAIELEIQ